MPRRDLYHETVKNALIKDGWTITHDPLMLGDPELRFYADLCVEKILDRPSQQTRVIEIKVFGMPSLASELEKAIGQYVLYRSILRNENSPYLTYLAVPSHVYKKFFQKRIVRNVVRDETIHLLIFNPVSEEIERWID